MTSPVTTEALVDGDHDMPTEAEIQAMREEAENFRLPAPAPIPVRGRYYLTECEYCGWVGSSEQCGGSCGPDDDDVICPVCCSSICGDSPNEADTAKHGEAVYQRIVTAEASLATATSELARLRAEGEAKDRALKDLRADANALGARLGNTSQYDDPKVLRDLCWEAGNFLARRIVQPALARAATTKEG